MTVPALVVGPISREEHLGFLATGLPASYLQGPGAAGLRGGWRNESLGWRSSSGELVGVGLVGYRDVPVLGALAYVAEGPVVDWGALGAAAVTAPLVRFLRTRRVFGVRMTPSVALQRWEADTLRAALKAGPATRLRDVAPDGVSPLGVGLVGELAELGWHRFEAPGAGFGGRMHPRYRAHVDLTGVDDPATLLDAAWRRNLRRADRSGVEVRAGDEADLADFHRVYVETAGRDGFAPLGLAHFERMWRQLRAESPERVAVHLASVGGRVGAASISTRVGDVASYVYGASTTADRDARPSNALQWELLRGAVSSGAELLDLRGISDTLDPADPLFGLLRFKLGLGAAAVELVGEWELPIRPLRQRAVGAYLDRRR